MLAEIKPDIRPEAAVADLDKQIKTVQERLQAQTVLPPKPTGTDEASQSEEQLVNFGWEEIMDGPVFLPFVIRQTEKYVANQIVAELVYKKIQNEFSNEMRLCMAPIMEEMTQEEAKTFDDINITHCDKNIVGDYRFKANEFMIKFEYVKKLVDYYKACKNLLLHKIKDNNLFGFISITGEGQVPFIYSDNRKLVPLFYFEGPSQYLDARSTYITDPFKIGYLRFCCKVQKINKDFYEQIPLKVVDVDDVRKLFPETTTFHVDIPEKINEDLLAPEIRLARLHGMEEQIQVTQDRHTSIPSFSNAVEEEINNNIPSSEMEPNENSNSSADTVIVDNSLVESKKRKDNIQEEIYTMPAEYKTLATEFRKYKEHMELNRIETVVGRRGQKRSVETASDIKAKKSKIDEVNIAFKSSTISRAEDARNHLPKSTSCGSLPQTLRVAFGQVQQFQDMSKISQEYSVTPIQQKEANEQQTNVNERILGLATYTSTVAPSSVLSKTNQGIQITNVPHQSPRGASSPGYPQATQVINEAAHRVAEYSQACTSVIESNISTHQMTLCTTSDYPSDVNLHQSYTSQQLSNNTQHYPSVINAQQHNSIPRSVPNRSSNFGSYCQPQPVQVSSSHQLSNNTQHCPSVSNAQQHNSIPRLVRNRSSNFESYYQPQPVQLSSSQQLNDNTQHCPSIINAQQHNSIPRSVPNRSSNCGSYCQPQPVQVSSSQSQFHLTQPNGSTLQYQGSSDQHNLEQKQRVAWLERTLRRQQLMKEQITKCPISVPYSTHQVMQQTSFLHHRPQETMQHNSVPPSQQLTIQQPTGYSCPPGMIIPTQTFQTTPNFNVQQPTPVPHYQQYDNPLRPVHPQGVNISYTNNTLSQNSVQNLSSSLASLYYLSKQY